MIEWRMTSGWIQIQDQLKSVDSAAPIFCEDLLAEFRRQLGRFFFQVSLVPVAFQIPRITILGVW
ncbi:hypothetical protein OUZ56_011930 [Daphnia magna]|uniref:Uncharacterized protein n=1 Tax=Daphnia magna TaxID=35525 RepID=A0ABQ9Z1J2_9CRUS|nr:hypothetical protein OUZ56_011930 [Daphnia magna]